MSTNEIELANKQIKITGINNKYQLKKVTEEKKEPKQRRAIEKWNLSLDENIYDNQVQLKYLVTEDTHNTYRSHDIYETMKREIEKKMNGYKQQDIDKKRLSNDLFITFNDVKILLIQCKLLCYYCTEKTYILYEHVRESSQWTLDRIDNNMGHNLGNVVICCLKCNLKRRRTNSNNFFFTKQLTIIRK